MSARQKIPLELRTRCFFLPWIKRLHEPRELAKRKTDWYGFSHFPAGSHPLLKKSGKVNFLQPVRGGCIRRLSKQINFPFLPSGWDLLLLQSWPCFILSCVTPRLRAERVEIIHTLYWPRGWQLVGGNCYWWVPVVVNLLTCLCDFEKKIFELLRF